jgi:hypothetical protein
VLSHFLTISLLVAARVDANAQSPVAIAASPTDAQPIALASETRLALLLRNGVNTRTAKPGDSVYFETIYPIAHNNRIVIPIGSFLRGELLSSKRPGFVKGRGEIRMVLVQITPPNGYTLSLAATPSSTDRDAEKPAPIAAFNLLMPHRSLARLRDWRYPGNAGDARLLCRKGHHGRRRADQNSTHQRSLPALAKERR